LKTGSALGAFGVHTVSAPALLWSLIHLNAFDDEVGGIQSFSIGIAEGKLVLYCKYSETQSQLHTLRHF